MMNRFFTLLLAASCLTAVGQSEYCLDGTVWDATLGGCVPEVIACGVISDLDGDGAVGSSDLLSLLTDYGYVFTDVDSDGVCDEIDECVGGYDECGVCNGPGAIYECGCYGCNQFEQCGDLVSYQGYDYETVQIGNQCWFAENLRAENYRNGDPITGGVEDLGSSGDLNTLANVEEGATGVYGEGVLPCESDITVPDACDENWSLEAFGRHYDLASVLDERQLCPSGWHVPSAYSGDWEILVNTLINDTITALQSTSLWQSGEGSNETGFSALPAGVILDCCTQQGAWGAGELAVFWADEVVGYYNGGPNDYYVGATVFVLMGSSSSEDSYFSSDNISYFSGWWGEEYATGGTAEIFNFGGFSVRCIKD